MQVVRDVEGGPAAEGERGGGLMACSRLGIPMHRLLRRLDVGLLRSGRLAAGGRALYTARDRARIDRVRSALAWMNVFSGRDGRA